MRRSKSSSNIPLPKFKRTLSSESLRDSQGLKRTNSSSHLIPPKSTLSSRLGAKTKERGSSCTRSTLDIPGSSRKNTATPLRTPTSQRSSILGSLSPGQLLTSQKINDKKFSADQYRKICEFLETVGQVDFDPKSSLKPLTLKMFVAVITLLFKEIDPRINITMENYKETVLKYLKLYKYPGIISLSLLKSVNTNHSWPSVMAIFGWLVDIICEMNPPDDSDGLTNYLALRFKAKFKDEDAKGKYVHFIDEIIGLDEERDNELEDTCEKLRRDNNAKEKVRAELQQKVQHLRNQHEQMEADIKEFKEGNLEFKIKKEIDDNKGKLKTKRETIKNLESSLKQTADEISKQKYKIGDKKSLEKELEAVKFSLNLKKEEFENIRKIREKYDFDQTNGRRQIESEVHKINALLLELKLNRFDEQAKKIQLPDKGFHSLRFLDIVEEKRRLLVDYKGKIESRYLADKDVLREIEKSLVSVSATSESLRENKRSLESEMVVLKNEIERVMFENDVLKSQFEKKVSDLKKSAPDVEMLSKENDEKMEELNKLDNECYEYSKKSIEFFEKVYEGMAESTAKNRNLMKTIVERFLKDAQKSIEQLEQAEKFMLAQIDNIDE